MEGVHTNLTGKSIQWTYVTARVPVCALKIKRNTEKFRLKVGKIDPRTIWPHGQHRLLSQIRVSAMNLTQKLYYSPNFKPNSFVGRPGDRLCRPGSLGDGGKPPQLRFTERIIVNEKSLRGIMLSTGSLFPFPPSAPRSTWRSGGFSLSFGIQELLPGN